MYVKNHTTLELKHVALQRVQRPAKLQNAILVPK